MFGLFTRKHSTRRRQPPPVRRRSSESVDDSAASSEGNSRIVVPQHGPFAGATRSDIGSWIAHTDANGFSCWCNDATGQWTYQLFSAPAPALMTPQATFGVSPVGAFGPTPVPPGPFNTNPFFIPTDSPVMAASAASASASAAAAAAAAATRDKREAEETKKREAENKRRKEEEAKKREAEEERRKKEEAKKREEQREKEREGYWKAIFNERGVVKYWQHTVTGKRKYDDPYF